MKKLLLLFFIFSQYKAIAQLPDYGLYNVHIADSGKFIRTQVTPTSGTVTAHPTLFYYWYGSNLIHEQQGGFSGKLLNGTYEEYDKNHHLTIQGGFKNGLKNGIWKTWNASGFLTSVVTWDEGVKAGKFAYYDLTGKETETGKHANNQLNGKIVYHTGTDSVKTIIYEDGKVVPPKNGSFLKRINIFRKKPAKTLPVQTQ